MPTHSRRKGQESGLTHCHGLRETRCWRHSDDCSGLWTGVHTLTHQKNNYPLPPVQMVQFIHRPDWKSSSCIDGSLECQRSAALTVCSRLCRVTLCRKDCRVFHRAHWGKMQVKVKMQTERKYQEFKWEVSDHCEPPKSNTVSNKDTHINSTMLKSLKCSRKTPIGYYSLNYNIGSQFFCRYCVLLYSTVDAGLWETQVSC